MAKRVTSAHKRHTDEAELAEKYRDLPIPEGFETMEVFPYEAFADVQDLKRFRQIKEEEGVVRARSTSIPPIKMDIFALLPRYAWKSGLSPRSVLMAMDDWEVWRGTGPWVGVSKPIWRSIENSHSQFGS